MYIVQNVFTNTFLFGDKTYTRQKRTARKFTSKEEAQTHIDEWLDPDDVEIVPESETA
jgi:hypothetical protein